jgi:broad specificity phosphatase PhoE
LGDTAGFKLWTSCLKRTIQTARKIEAPQEHLDALNELNTGVCDGLTYEEIAERYPIEFAARDDDKFHYRYPEGESYFDLLLRVKPVLDRLKVENNVMVIAHQAVLRCLLAVLLNKDEKELPYIHTPLHTVMRLSFKPADGGCHLDLIPLSIECVETHRAKPEVHYFHGLVLSCEEQHLKRNFFINFRIAVSHEQLRRPWLPFLHISDVMLQSWKEFVWYESLAQVFFLNRWDFACTVDFSYP